MAQPDPQIQKAQTLLRGFGFHARVRGEDGQTRRTPLEVTGVEDSLTQRSLRRFRADNGLPENADLQTTIAKMEEEGVSNKYKESLIRQGFQYPYTGQTIAPATAAPATAAPATVAPAAAAPAAPTAASAAPAATASAAKAKPDSEGSQTDTASATNTAPEATVEQAQAYLRILGYNNVGPVDNIRGPLTNGALTQFARDNQMAENASLNDLTAAMKAKVISDPNVMVRAETIIRGDNPSRSEVLAAQYAINARSGGHIATDGLVGGETTTAFYNTRSLEASRAPSAVAATPAPAAGPASPVAAVAEAAPVAAPVQVPAATPVSATPAAAVAAAATPPAEDDVRSARQRRIDPVEPPAGYQIGHRGRLSPYQRDVASYRREDANMQGREFDPARPPSLQEMRMEEQRRRMEEIRERREGMQRERDVNMMGRGVSGLLDGNHRNDGQAVSSVVGIIARNLNF